MNRVYGRPSHAIGVGQRDGAAARFTGIVPWEFVAHTDFFPEPPVMPEKKLLLAVLENGLKAARGPAGPLRDQAREWVAAPWVDWPFDFEAICETLNLSAEWIRRQLGKGTQLRLVQRNHHALVAPRAVSLKPYWDQRGRER